MGEGAAPLYLLGKLLFFITFRLFNRWEVTGRDCVPTTGGVLLIANHTSYADPPIVGTACPRPVYFMAKAELFFFPLGPIITRTHAFPVSRGGDRAAVRRAIRLLQGGRVVLVFPEGTRSKDGRLQELETGAAFIALSAGAHVVPAGIDGADRLLPMDGCVPRPAKLRVRLGPPVDLSDLRAQRPTRAVLQQATNRMAAAMRDLLPYERGGNLARPGPEMGTK